MFEARFALAESFKAGGRDGVQGNTGLRLTDVRGGHLAQVAVFRGQEREFKELLHACSGVDIPAKMYRSASHGESRIVRISAGQYWWMARDGASMARFARELHSCTGTVTVLSAARVRIRITGSAARELLQKGMALDLHPEEFQIGASALVGLHHTGVFLERLSEEAFEIYIMRTYAEWIWDWLIDAALPFGYDIEIEELGKE